MPLIKNQGRYGELGHWGKRSSRRFTKKKILLLGTLLSLSLIFAISHNGGPIPIVFGDYNSSFSHTRTLIFGDTLFQGPVTLANSAVPTNEPGCANQGVCPNTRFSECIVSFPSTITLTTFSLTLKKVGTPTGTLIGRVWNGLGQGAQNPKNCLPNNLAWTDSQTTIDLSTIPTSYTVETFTFSGFPLTSGVSYAFGVWLSCSPACTGSNYVTAGISSTSTNNENAALFNTFAGNTCADTLNNACPTNWDYQFSVSNGPSSQATNQLVRWNYNSTCVTVNGNIVFDYSLGSFGSGGSNCSSADIAITKSPYGFQTVSGRMFELVTAWQNNAITKLANLTFTLRATNGTLPSFTENYNPFNDVQARMIWTLCPTYLCSTSGLQSIYIAHDQSKTIRQEGLANDLIIQGTTPQLNATNIPFGAQAVLNFTGPNNYINEYTSALTTNVSNNTASGLQFGQTYYVMVQSTFLTSLAPCGGCNTATIAFGPSGGVTARSMSLWSVPSSCTDAINKVACGLGTATPVFQFNPLDPSSWGNAIIQGLLWVFTVAVPSGLKVVAAVLLQFLAVTFNFVGNQLGWGNIGDNIVTFINGLPSLFGQVGAVLGNLASIVSSVINTIIIANLLANPYFAGLVNILNDIKNVLSSGLVINFLTEVAIWFPTSYMIILIATYFLFVLLKGLHGFFDWIHLVKWSSFQMVGLFSLFIYVFGKLITAMLGRMSIISPGHEFPHIPHPDPGELPKIHLNGEVAFFDDPTAWFLGFTGFIFTMMWAGTSAAGLPANTQTIIQSFSGLFLTLFGVGFMILLLYIPGFLLGKLYQKGIIS